MADARAATAPARLAMTFAVVAATAGGWLLLASTEVDAGAVPAAEPNGAALPALPPLPALDPLPNPARAQRWPAPVATTRASR